MNHRRFHPARRATGPWSETAFTLIEILIVIALVGTLSAISIPMYFRALEKARVTRAIADIKNISLTLTLYQSENDTLPDTLDAIGMGTLRDPWGHPYAYLKIEGLKGKGKVRKDKNLVPINTDYDLYSMGPDGKTSTPLTAQPSRDDIVRANNGAFVGVASDY